jgi:hypothetical protein
MPRRRRIGLGSSEAVHRERVQEALKRAKLFDRTAELVRNGECKAALDELLGMQEALGALRAERVDAQATSSRIGKDSSAMLVRLMRARRTFADHCTR